MKDIEEEISLAGIADEEGRVERPLADTRWHKPDVVELEADRLVYQYGARPTVSSGPGLLTAFVKLADAPETAMRDYARRWGPLRLCEHGLPATHNRPALAPSVAHQVTWCEPRGFDSTSDQQIFWEPLKEWRGYAHEARTLLLLAAQLHQGNPTPADDWCRALGWSWEAVDRYLPNGTGTEWHIAQRVNDWLAWGASRFTFDWRPGRKPAMSIGGGGLFGALAAELMLAIARSDGLAICSACGVPYFPSRKPSRSRRSYCQTCRQAGRAERDATRAYQGRKRIRRAGGR